jgi:hypothetical protein
VPSVKRVTCAWPECGREFEAKRSTAKFCSVTCRSRAARDRKAAAAAEKVGQVSAHADPDGLAEHALVTAVRRELVEARALQTVDGQIALQLARKVVDVAASGISPLARELRVVLDRAKAAGAKPPGDDDAGHHEEPSAEDEVARARRLREEARQAAGLT